MKSKSELLKTAQWMVLPTMTAMLLGLTGCQPEGVGTVKPPETRGDDSQLGRPFGNAPELPKAKKDAPGKATKEGAEPKNSRL